MKNNPKITLLLRSDKKRKDNTCPIYFNVRYQRKSYKFPSEYSVKENDWNAREKAPKNLSMKNILQKRKLEFDDWVMKMVNEKRPISVELIKDFFSGNVDCNFFEFYENVLAENSKRLMKSTLKGYRTNINALKEFKEEISFNEIDLAFILRFDNFLRAERNLAEGGRFGHHKNLKVILKRAVRERRISENPYGEDFKMPKVLSRTVWLNEIEVNMIESVNIPAKLTSLINARERFLFSCYSGLRYGDVVTLEWDHIKTIDGKKYMVKILEKGRKPAIIPLYKNALDILKRRKGKNSKYVFDPISNQKLNAYVQEVCKLAKINKHVTTHIGRHSFASIAVSKGADIYKLSKVMVHSSVKVTEKYAKFSLASLHSLVAE